MSQDPLTVKVVTKQWGTIEMFPITFDLMIGRHLPASVNDLRADITMAYLEKGEDVPDLSSLDSVTEGLAVLALLDGKAFKQEE